MVKFIKENVILIIAMMIAFSCIFMYNSTNVEGISMQSTLKSGDKLITDIYSKNYQRKDMVILFADNKGQGFVASNLINTLFQVNYYKRMIYVKRIVGLPGEYVEMRNKDVIIYNNDNPNGMVLVESYAKKDWLCSDQGGIDRPSGNPTSSPKVQIPANSYFVMGDNRGCSKDSRMIGSITSDSIIGRIVVKL